MSGNDSDRRSASETPSEVDENDPNDKSDDSSEIKDHSNVEFDGGSCIKYV